VLEAAKEAIIGVLTDIIADLWRDAWSVGERSARKLTGAVALAVSYLRDYLTGARDRARQIAQTLAGRLATALAATGTAEALLEALASAGEWIAWAELARAQWAAAVAVYREAAIMYASWQTEHDAAVCARCAENERAGALLLGEQYPSGNAWPPAHPRCRCALLPVEAVRAA
jgi:hypothetical protein